MKNPACVNVWIAIVIVTGLDFVTREIYEGISVVGVVKGGSVWQLNNQLTELNPLIVCADARAHGRVQGLTLLLPAELGTLSHECSILTHKKECQ